MAGKVNTAMLFGFCNRQRMSPPADWVSTYKVFCSTDFATGQPRFVAHSFASWNTSLSAYLFAQNHTKIFLVNDQRVAQFFSMYLFLFITLYMFRAHRAHHQERQIVSIQTLVTVSLCWWPFRFQFFRPAHDTATDSYHRLYWHSLSLLMMSTMSSKHVES